MSASDVTSHFWIAGEPFFSTTLLVAPGDGLGHEGRSTSLLEIYDVDGVRVNSVEVEFPADQVGVIELEPFIGSLKMQGGVRHGHLAITSPAHSRHVCRHALQQHVSLSRSPTVVRSRESCFIPLIVGGQREHLVALVNAGLETAQVTLRMFYGNRSPEWNLTLAPNGCKVLALEGELLADADDKAWEKGPLQSYIRLSARHQTLFTCQVFERIPGEAPEHDIFRCVTSW
jgi:hypothetical protein